MFMIWIGPALGLSIFFLFAPSRSRVDVINNNNNNKSLFYLFCFFPAAVGIFTNGWTRVVPLRSLPLLLHYIYVICSVTDLFP